MGAQHLNFRTLSMLAATTKDSKWSLFETLANNPSVSKFYPDDEFCVIKDISPIANGHFQVYSKKNVLKKIWDADESHSQYLGRIMLKASSVGKKEFPGGFRLIINCGDEGCQSIDHLHIYVVGGEQLSWPHLGAKK